MIIRKMLLKMRKAMKSENKHDIKSDGYLRICYL